MRIGIPFRFHKIRSDAKCIFPGVKQHLVLYFALQAISVKLISFSFFSLALTSNYIFIVELLKFFKKQLNEMREARNFFFYVKTVGT